MYLLEVLPLHNEDNCNNNTNNNKNSNGNVLMLNRSCNNNTNNTNNTKIVMVMYLC